MSNPGSGEGYDALAGNHIEREASSGRVGFISVVQYVASVAALA